MFRPIFFLLLITVKLVSGQTNPQRDAAAIRQARTASNTAIASHDVAGVIQSMLPDYTIVTGRGRQVAGRDSMAVFWKKTFTEMPGVIYIRTPSAIVISKNDTLAWETGQWKAVNSYSGGGNYSAMWRKKDGVWKTQSELFVSLEK